MLNKAPNNNDFKRIANFVLIEAPNSNDAMDVRHNVCLTAMHMGAQQFSLVAI